jgi:Tol biopolymer transport system component
MPDGRSLVFSMGDMDRPSLATMAVNGSGPATRLLGEGDYGWLPTVLRAPNGRARLVYTQHFESVNIWRSDLSAGKPAERLIDSAHWSYEPAWSADGKRVVFLSDRSGYGELWVADQDGKRPQQWTFLKLPRLGSPRWSPDGRRIAFTAPGPRGSSIFLIDGPAAAPRPVPGAERCGYLDWSSDGKALFYSSGSGSNYDVWKIAAEGGEPVRMTFDRGRVPSASSDGKYLYFLKLAGADGRNDLWRLPLNGGREEKVLEFVDAYSLGDTGIAFKFYRPGERPAGPFLEFHSFATGKTERLPAASRPLRYGIALSRDGRRLLHAQADYDVSDLMLVDLPR